MAATGSPFKVWLHPRRAFAELEEARRRVTELEEARECDRQELERRDAGMELLRRQLADRERERLRLAGELAELHKTCDAQTESLREWEEASREMERMAGELEKMQALRDMMAGMRKEYEERIARLERQLWSSRSGGLQYTDPAMDIPDPSESELLEPGESPFISPAPIAVEGRRPPVLPAADDTDWLLPLPD